jgi:2-keto-4-pentenoate hydratase/2-oxohepta-3-ene-1,7-dioic acid hydratase in catechol pathway
MVHRKDHGSNEGKKTNVKFASVVADGNVRVALVSADGARVWPLAVRNMVELICDYDSISKQLPPAGAGLEIKSVQLAAPIPRATQDLLCVGKNYREHAREFAHSGFDGSAPDARETVPEVPIFFTKASRTVIGPDEAIRYPHGVSDKLDYEAELAVVIGRGGKAISREAAYGHVFGYTIINDVTARDLQRRHRQWFIGKSLDTFCPMGPWIVTSDEVDAENLDLRCWVNDELRQSANTRDLIFDIPKLIETVSAGMTLVPGDIIATGTPKGVGIGFNPPKYLRPGDKVTIEIGNLGRLTNSVL